MRRPSFRLLLSISFLSGFAAAAHADLEDRADTIVVTATRIPTPEEQVASSITVVTADDISSRQLQTLPDVLKQVPGVSLIQTGGPGGQTSVFMRGTNSNHTKVLIDGIDVSDPSNSGGAFDFAHSLTQDVQKVEILRGPQSGLYGSDAIGGVINIITKSGSGPAQINAAAEGGSFDTFNQIRRRERLGAAVSLCRECRSPAFGNDAGDAAGSIGARRAAHRRLLRQLHRIDEARLRRRGEFRLRAGRALHRHASASHRRERG